MRRGEIWHSHSNIPCFFKVWMLPVQLSYLWQSGVTAGFPGILQHKTIRFNHVSRRNNLLLMKHWIIKTTYLSSQNTHSVAKGQTSQNVFLYDVSIYVSQVIGSHIWITSFSMESSHNNSWHLRLLFLKLLHEKDKGNKKCTWVHRSSLKPSHSQRCERCDSQNTHNYPYKQTLAHKLLPYPDLIA